MSDRQGYEAEIQAFRAEREKQFREENGWLALAGLFWLEDGDMRLGTGAENEIVLPAGTAPDYLATLIVNGDDVHLSAPAGAPVFVNGEAVTEIDLVPNIPGPATFVTSGSLAWIIKREDSLLALRLWDNGRAARDEFPGRQWFRLDEAYRVEAAFTKAAKAQHTLFPRTFGLEASRETVGQVEFALNGKQLSLQALPGYQGRLWLIFKDATSGDSTYGAGRYLITEKVKNGRVILDFNKAYSPPCSVTDFATCMFPPPANHLPVAIPVGEKNHGWSSHESMML